MGKGSTSTYVIVKMILPSLFFKQTKLHLLGTYYIIYHDNF